MGVVGGVDQLGLGSQHIQDLLGIGLPVGRAVQGAAGLEAGRQFGDQRGLDQAALVVFFLVPRIGEKNVDAVEQRGAAFGQHVVHHLDRVMLQDADVAELLRLDAFEQRSHAGRVNFAAEEIFLRHQCRNVGGGFAHAKTDLQNGRGVAAKQRFNGGQFGRVVHQKPRPLRGKSLGLAERGAARAAHKTANGARMGHGVGSSVGSRSVVGGSDGWTGVDDAGGVWRGGGVVVVHPLILRGAARSLAP